MKVIITRVHGILDYLVSLILIGAPWILGFSQGGAETWVPVILGVASIIYSLMTSYEFSVARMIVMRTHLGLDIASGIVLALSPWIFRFSSLVYMPHLILGILEVGVALMTDPSPYKQHEGNIAGQT
jgi:hypothetical protein